MYSINSDEKVPLLNNGDGERVNVSKTSTLMKVDSPVKEINKSFPPEYEDTKKGGTSAFGTLFNFAKASVGSGSFALPWGLAQAGIILGSIAMLIIGILSLYTMILIIELKRGCQKLIQRTETDISVASNSSKKSDIPAVPSELDFSTIGSICLGKIGRICVDFSVIICNLGVCAGYMLFIGANLRTPLHCWFNYPDNILLTYAILIPILILLTLIPSFRFLAYAALIGWLFLAIAMGTVYYYGFSHGFSGDIVLFNIEGFPLFYGVTAFLFCVHSMVIPLESEMARSTRMNIVLLIASFIVVGVNLPFAIFGYVLFGPDTEGVIFDNLPSGLFNNIVRLMLSVELTLTFPIVFKPASQIFENYWMMVTKRFWLLRIIVIRPILVLISWGMAIGIPFFNLMAALVGGFATTLLAFIWPPLFHFVLLRKETHIARNIFHIVLFVFGVLSILSTTGTIIYQLVDHPDSSHPNGSNLTNETHLAIVCESIPMYNINMTHSNDSFLLSRMF